MIKKIMFILLTMWLLPPAFSGIAHAIAIQFEVEDLPDATPGEDLQQYAYTVSDQTFNAEQGFTIFFDHTLYKALEDPPPPVNDDWDVIVWQPDLALPDSGAYDALSVTATADGASLADPFIVRFVWLGVGEPNAQRFEVYQKEPFNILESGETIRKVQNPEDVNGDNQVNIFDLVIVAGQFGQTPPDNPAADINSDGTVNIFDLVLVARRFGETFGGQTAAPLASHSTSPRLEVKMVAQQTDTDALTIQIHVAPGMELGGYHFDLRFDSERLSVMDISEGGFFAAQGNRSYWLPPKMENGSIQLQSVALNTPNSSNAVTPSAILAGITFRVKGDINPAMRSIRLERAQLADLTGGVIFADVRPLDKIRTISFAVDRPLQDALFQNYPNPFNPETWIPYALAESSVVTIQIYNARGVRIRSLELGFQPAGFYTKQADAAHWDGRDKFGEQIASGLYYFTISAGDFTATRKMLIVK